MAMNLALVMAGLAAGVAAMPHCAAMCAAPCAAMTSGCRRSGAGFHVARVLGYMAGGALAAGSVGLLAGWSQAVPVLRPLWTLLHLGLLAVGLWWLATGRQPAWMQRRSVITIEWRGHSRDQSGHDRDHGDHQRSPSWRRPLRAAIAGLAWVGWPCAALQAALLLAALANDALGGALVMAAFAVGSMPALAAVPWAWSRWRALRGQRGSGAPVASGTVPAAALNARAATMGLRLAGAGLAIGSGWALTHGLWLRVAAWCAGALA